jgi:polysaccharide deacetylase 2 family uncharacterized protein YibQ
MTDEERNAVVEALKAVQTIAEHTAKLAGIIKEHHESIRVLQEAVDHLLTVAIEDHS